MYYNNPKFAKSYIEYMLNKKKNHLIEPFCKPTLRHSIKPLATLASLPAVSPLQVQKYYTQNNSVLISSAFATNNPTIVIIDAYCKGSYASDLNLFSSYFNLPLMNINGVVTSPTLGNFTIIYQSATGSTTFTKTVPTYSSNTGWDGEIALDIQYAHSIAPYVDIVLILSATASIADLSKAITYGNSLLTLTGIVPSTNIIAMSMSFGANESASAVNSFTTLFNKNIIYCASSGDSSSTARTTVPQLVPAVCNNVIAVGGTSLNVATVPNVESGWNQAGGGVSTIVAKPAFQNITPLNTYTKRCVPDIAALADPYTGVYIFLNGSLSGAYGGTSLASPMFAALIALMVQLTPSFANSNVSLNQTSLQNLFYTGINNKTIDVSANSVTTTWTDKYNTVTGYDFVTGCGSPNFVNLLASIPGAATPFVVKR